MGIWYCSVSGAAGGFNQCVLRAHADLNDVPALADNYNKSCCGPEIVSFCMEHGAEYHFMADLMQL